MMRKSLIHSHIFLFLVVLGLPVSHLVTAFLTRVNPITRAYAVNLCKSSDVTVVEQEPATVTSKEQEVPRVQREYERFLWKHELHNYNINYRVEGPTEGPPVLLVHGFGANVNHFRYQFPALVAQGYRVYAIDLLGFGASDKPPDENYSIELWVSLLVDFVKAMQPHHRQWIVAGNSIGGLCSLALAEQLNHTIKGVVLFNCAGGMTGFRNEDVSWYVRPILYMVQRLLQPPLGSLFYENFKTRENVESILYSVYCDPENVNEELLDTLLGPSDDEGAEQVFLKVFGGAAGPTPESMLPNVACPILALWGDSDPWTPMDAGKHPGTGFGNFMTDEGLYTLIPLKGVGHCPHDENPELCHRYMIPWMKSLPDVD